MIVFYNHKLKKLGLERQIYIAVPNKIARRIRTLAKKLKDHK